MAKKSNPFIAEVDETSFFPFPALKQRIDMIRHLYTGDSPIILILGESGSGKTLMMKQLLAADANFWKGCRVNAHESVEPGFRMVEHQAYLFRKDDVPIMMMDDAQSLMRDELEFLIRLVNPYNPEKQIDKLILISDYSILALMTDLEGTIPDNNAVEKVYIPLLSRQETETYVFKRLASVGMHRKELFTPYELDIIYEGTGGCPGNVNREAARMYDQKLREGGAFKRFLKNFF